MSIFSAFIQAFRYDSMLTVIESNFLESYQDVILYLNGLLVIWFVKLHMSGRDLKSKTPSRSCYNLIPRFLYGLGACPCNHSSAVMRWEYIATYFLADRWISCL